MGLRSKKWEWMEWMGSKLDTPKNVMTTRAPVLLTNIDFKKQNLCWRTTCVAP